mmetsp:Transcript_40178/g.106327  ORF Transcript_40178/g.106327 Transcript_40178/m.106327 type:complete len:91 (-) Transcript_40178:1640-1912(-)
MNVHFMSVVIRNPSDPAYPDVLCDALNRPSLPDYRPASMDDIIVSHPERTISHLPRFVGPARTLSHDACIQCAPQHPMRGFNAHPWREDP